MMIAIVLLTLVNFPLVIYLNRKKSYEENKTSLIDYLKIDAFFSLAFLALTLWHYYSGRYYPELFAFGASRATLAVLEGLAIKFYLPCLKKKSEAATS